MFRGNVPKKQEKKSKWLASWFTFWTFSVFVVIVYRDFFFIPLQSEVEESLKRIQGHKGVVGIVIVNQEGRETQLFWSIFIAYQNTRSTLSLKAYSGRLLSFLSAYFVRWFVNTAGIPIRTTMDNSTTVQYAGLIHQLTAKARSTVRDIDPQVRFVNCKKVTFAQRNDKSIYLKNYWSYFCDKLINKWCHKAYESTPQHKSNIQFQLHVQAKLAKVEPVYTA